MHFNYRIRSGTVRVCVDVKIPILLSERRRFLSQQRDVTAGIDPWADVLPKIVGQDCQNEKLTVQG